MTPVERIDGILKQKGMSRRAFARSIGMAPSTFQTAMEKGGNFSLENAAKIAIALDIPIYQLISSHISSGKVVSNMRQLTRTLITRGNPNVQFPADSPLQEFIDSLIPITDEGKDKNELNILWWYAIDFLKKAGLDFDVDSLSKEEFGKDFYHHSDVIFKDTGTGKVYKIEYEKFEKRIGEMISFVKYTVNQLVDEASEE